MSFFNKINNNTIVDTLKQFCNRRDCKIFCIYECPANQLLC